jgi:hypothetical protein
MKKPRHPKSQPRRSWFSVAWSLFFAVNDKFITYQQRRNWRARATFFLLLGIVLTIVVERILFQRYGLCPK